MSGKSGLGIISTALAAIAGNIFHPAKESSGSSKNSNRKSARKHYLQSRRRRKGLKKSMLNIHADINCCYAAPKTAG